MTTNSGEHIHDNRAPNTGCPYEAPHVTMGADVSVREFPPRQREGFKTFKYKSWFGNMDIGPPEFCRNNGCFIDQVHKCVKMRTLAAFRLGQSWLHCEVQRPTHPIRSTRICEICQKGEIEDELHVCFCEAYGPIRDSFDIFSSREYQSLKTLYESGVKDAVLDRAMNVFMNECPIQGFWDKLADYLTS